MEPADRDDVLGALDELFQVRSHRSGRLRAVVWYWLQVAGFLFRWPLAQWTDGRHVLPPGPGGDRATLLATVGQDLLFALRQLRNNKGFTASAILILVGAHI